MIPFKLYYGGIAWLHWMWFPISIQIVTIYSRFKIREESQICVISLFVEYLISYSSLGTFFVRLCISTHTISYIYNNIQLWALHVTFDFSFWYFMFLFTWRMLTISCVVKCKTTIILRDYNNFLAEVEQKFESQIHKVYTSPSTIHNKDHIASFLF